MIIYVINNDIEAAIKKFKTATSKVCYEYKERAYGYQKPSLIRHKHEQLLNWRKQQKEKKNDTN